MYKASDMGLNVQININANYYYQQSTGERGGGGLQIKVKNDPFALTY